MEKVLKYLRDKQIAYTLYHHPAVYTCEEAEKYCGHIPGLAGKSLFLTDEKARRFYLVLMPAAKRLDLKKLARVVGAKRLSFARPTMLKEKLGLEPGAVSPFGLLNDRQNEVKLYINREVHNAEIVGFHPNINTATVTLSGEMFRKFLSTFRQQRLVVNE